MKVRGEKRQTGRGGGGVERRTDGARDRRGGGGGAEREGDRGGREIQTEGRARRQNS